MNKYKMGKRLTFKGLVKELLSCRYVYLGTRPTHWGWCREMSFNTLFHLALKGRFYKAIEINPKPEENK